MDLFVRLALKYIGTPYIYGGKNPLQGLDCSGLVCELLTAIGLFQTGTEYNAQHIYLQVHPLSEEHVFGPGSLAFYGKSLTEIDHVAFFLNTHQVIEAGHGTSQTLTKEIAAQRGACVRVRPFDYRKDLVAILRPKYEEMGLVA